MYIAYTKTIVYRRLSLKSALSIKIIPKINCIVWRQDRIFRHEHCENLRNLNRCVVYDGAQRFEYLFLTFKQETDGQTGNVPLDGAGWYLIRSVGITRKCWNLS